MKKTKRIYGTETSFDPEMQLKPIDRKADKNNKKGLDSVDLERNFTPDLIQGIIRRIKKL
jgi:hypothetical protein